MSGNKDKKTLTAGPFGLPKSALFHFKDIDREHQQLVDMLNTMVADFGSSDRIEGPRLAARIVELRDLMATHFATEEGEMAAAGFEGLAVHRTHHREVFDKVNAMHTEIVSMPTAGKEPVFDLFNHVLVDLLKDDLPFKDFLAACGFIRTE